MDVLDCSSPKDKADNSLIVYSISSRQLKLLLWSVRPDSKMSSSEHFSVLASEVEVEEVVFLVLCHLVPREFNIKWQHYIFNFIYTLFRSVKKIVQSAGYAGLSGLAVHSKSSKLSSGESVQTIVKCDYVVFDYPIYSWYINGNMM